MYKIRKGRDRLETFKRLKDFYWPYRKSLYVSLFFLLFVTAITVVYPIVLQLTIDEVVLKDKFSLIPYIALVFFLLMIVKGVATFIHQYLGDLFGITSVYKLRSEEHTSELQSRGPLVCRLLLE